MSDAAPSRDSRIRVAIINPSDPAGVVAGGIDTFIRGVIAWAPEDISFSVVGATTQPQVRPVGQWITARAGGVEFPFFAATTLQARGLVRHIPVSLRYSISLARRRPVLDAQVLEFHRSEPILNYINDLRSKSAVFHQDIEVLENPDSDIFWKHFPWLYHALERRTVPRLQALFCVKQSAAVDYRRRYPELGEQIRFLPTWFEPRTFHVPDPRERAADRQWLQERLGVSGDQEWIVSVGRLDSQKDPQLLLEAFRELLQERPDTSLIFVGTGILGPELRRQAADVSDYVHFPGLMAPEEIARVLRAADLFAMTSAYEGMPIAVLEALASGLPVMTTEVGEVRLVVNHMENGFVAQERKVTDVLHGLKFCLENRRRLAGEACRKAVEPYSPSKVLEPVYENYRRLAAAR